MVYVYMIIYEYFISINSASNQSYQGKIKGIILQGYVRYWSLTKDLLLVKDLTASRSNLEWCPSSRGDDYHAAMLPSWKSSQKAHLGCHIYGMKLLARSQVTYLWQVRRRLLVLTNLFVP